MKSLRVRKDQSRVQPVVVSACPVAATRAHRLGGKQGDPHHDREKGEADHDLIGKKRHIAPPLRDGD